MFRFKSIRGKLLAIYVPFVCLSLMILFSILEFRFYHNQQADLLIRFDRLVTIGSLPMAEALWEVDTPKIKNLLAGMKSLPYVLGAATYDSSGEILGKVGKYDAVPRLPEFRKDQPLSVKKGQNEEHVGKLVVVIHSDDIWKDVYAHIQTNALNLFVLAALLVGVTLFVTREVIGKPIERLKTSIDRMQTENVRENVEWESSDELGEVVRAYNEMQNKQVAAESELKKHQEHLEDLVKVRTEELSKRVSELADARKRAEELREEAESATRAKAAFLAAMSHEIRTPMNGVVGMIDILRETKLNTDQHDMTGTIRDSAFSLLNIINDILDFSKIESGKLDLESVPIHITDILEGVAKTLAPIADQKNVRTSVYVDPEIPSSVMGDQVRVRQILFNLAGNAVKFTENTPDNIGKVTIRADRLSEDKNGMVTVRFSVTDTGIGMSKEGMSKLFQPFSQAESSTTRRFGGTGLGLTICKNLAEMMNGEIGVESEEGVGSTFFVMIPMKVAKTEPAVSDETDIAGLRVLAAAQDEDLLGFIRSYLEFWKLDVETATGLDEIEKAAVSASNNNEPFDAVIFGSEWSEEDVSKICESIRGNENLTGIRFVILTHDRSATRGAISPDMMVVESYPLRRFSLVNGVAVAAGKASPEIREEEKEEKIDLSTIEVPLVEEAEELGQLILVAEDNITNQKVILRQLNMLGYAAEIAPDGKEALEAWKSKSYAILLTDCHMPEMDGFELASTIRETEKDSGTRIPIVAITASVLQEEIDHCFEVGMDDFIPKPMEMVRLKSTLAKWMPDAVPARTAENEALPEKVSANGDVDGAIDPSVLKEIFGDDPETFKEILLEYVEPSEAIVEEMSQAFDERSAEKIGAAAHKLKSSSKSVGAHKLGKICESLEAAGKSGNWDEIEKSMPILPDAMKDVTDYIKLL